MVRIPAFHTGGPGSIPGVGTLFFVWSFKSGELMKPKHVIPKYINALMGHLFYVTHSKLEENVTEISQVLPRFELGSQDSKS